MKGARSTVAKQKQMPVKRQAITSHPLFPAVVGLWFGALFGLGSLAVRPSLIEDMVLSTRIDLIIPAAAPPLGITARIMLALVMAVLGAIVGVVLARRLTRPKPEHKERARTARGTVDAAQTRQRARDAHPDAPSCTPISMQDLESGDDEKGAASADNRLAGRRRGLTTEHVVDEFVPHEFAPLPGGEPQIFDLAAAESIAQLPAAEPAQQVFHSAPAAQPVLAPESAAAHADGRQVFGMEQANPQAEQPRQIFGVAAEGDHLPPDFVREAGYKTSVFETEVPKPLFERDPAGQDLVAPQIAAFAAAAPAEVAAPGPIAEVASFALPSPPAPVAADTPLAQASAPLPSPSSLGMTDLAARLAESMQRRRAARSAVSAEPAAPAPEPAAPAPTPFAQPDQFVAPVAAATAVAAPAPGFVPAALAAEAPVRFVAPIQVEPPAVIAVEAESDDALPSSLRPLALDAFLEEDLAFDASLLPPRRLVAEAPAKPDQLAASAQPFAVPAASAPEPAEEPIAEENYASLLGIGGQRPGFVRIEEPEADASAPEPVVIFPGQAPLGQAPQFTPQFTPPAPSDDSNPFRRFDSPAAAEHGQPVDQGSQGASVAPDEAAQALRTALASLQRISGAA